MTTKTLNRTMVKINNNNILKYHNDYDMGCPCLDYITLDMLDKMRCRPYFKIPPRLSLDWGTCIQLSFGSPPYLLYYASRYLKLSFLALLDMLDMMRCRPYCEMPPKLSSDWSTCTQFSFGSSSISFILCK